MIVISEYSIAPSAIENYHNKGYRFAYAKDNPVIRPKESVGVLLDTMYKSTIELIERLLYYKHKVTLKLDNKTYILNTLEDWKYTCQDPKDQIKTITYKHPVYQIYLDKRKEYFDKQKAIKRSKNLEMIYTYCVDIPEDEILESFLRNYAPLYQVDVDYTDTISKLTAYTQLIYYIEHNIEQIPRPNEEILVGDNTLLEDIYNSVQNHTKSVDLILKDVI